MRFVCFSVCLSSSHDSFLQPSFCLSHIAIQLYDIVCCFLFSVWFYCLIFFSFLVVFFLSSSHFSQPLGLSFVLVTHRLLISSAAAHTERWGNICLSRFSVSESWCTLKVYSSVYSEDAYKRINSSSVLFCCLPVLFTVSTNAVFCWYQVSLCESSQKLGGLFNQPSGWQTTELSLTPLDTPNHCWLKWESYWQTEKQAATAVGSGACGRRSWQPSRVGIEGAKPNHGSCSIIEEICPTMIATLIACQQTLIKCRKNAMTTCTIIQQWGGGGFSRTKNNLFNNASLSHTESVSNLLYFWHILVAMYKTWKSFITTRHWIIVHRSIW